MKVRDFYDRTAGIYDARHGTPTTMLLRKKELALIKKFARGRVLDIGCGTGYHMRFISNATGIDTSREMVKRAKKTGKRVLLGSAERLPFGDGSFGTALCLFTVLNMCDCAKAVREMARVLEPGGRAIISVASVHDSGKSRKKRFRVGGERFMLRLFTKEELTDIFGKEGFHLLRFDSLFRARRPVWGSFRRFSLKERVGLRLEELLPKEKGRMYLMVFGKD